METSPSEGESNLNDLKHIAIDKLEQELSPSLPSIVAFSLPVCPPCKVAKEALHFLLIEEKLFRAQLLFAYLDFDEEIQANQKKKYKLSMFPTLRIYNDASVIAEKRGAQHQSLVGTVDSYKRWIKRHWL